MNFEFFQITRTELCSMAGWVSSVLFVGAGLCCVMFFLHFLQKRVWCPKCEKNFFLHPTQYEKARIQCPKCQRYVSVGLFEKRERGED